MRLADTDSDVREAAALGHGLPGVARGVAAGASSHGAGTLCLAARGEADASAFASTTFAFGGAIAVLLVNLAPFQIALRALAGYP